MSELQRLQGPNGVSSVLPRGEIVTDAQHLEAIYKRARLDDIFERFAFGYPRADDDERITSEKDVYAAVHAYVLGMTPFIMNGERINVPFVRAAYEKVIDGMNLATSKKLGFEQPRTRTGALLATFGIKKPAPRQYIADLSDRYWEKQFIDQFSEYTEFPNESPTFRAVAYASNCLDSFAVARFSFVQQADHAS